MSELQRFNSPIGELEYVMITGEGKEDLQGNLKYQASVVLEGEKAEQAEKEIMAFWEANRPQNIKEPKSTGLYPHTVPTGETDEDGDKVYEETGKTRLQFKTGTTFKDGNPKIVKVFNAKGAEVALGDKKIGNGSRGLLLGNLAIYRVIPKGKQKPVEAGVTIYLEGVQLTKFIEYVGGVDAGAVEDDEVGEDAFDGVGEAGGVVDEGESKTSSKERPKL